METKKWYESKGMWGALVTVALVVLRLLGMTGIAELVETESGSIVEWIVALGLLIGSALAFVGRLKATKKIE